jgi:hypothetical protein
MEYEGRLDSYRETLGNPVTVNPDPKMKKKIVSAVEYVLFKTTCWHLGRQ